MTFFFGVITGIVMCIFIIIAKRQTGNPQLMSELEVGGGVGEVGGVDMSVRGNAVRFAILNPRSQVEQDRDNLVKENERRGKDTPLEDIL